MAWRYTKNNYLVVKILPPAPQISNILHHSAGKYNIQDHSTCIYVFLDFVFCLCYCGSRDRHNPGDRAGGVSYTALSCNFPRHTLYLQKKPQWVKRGDHKPYLLQKSFVQEQALPRDQPFPAPQPLSDAHLATLAPHWVSSLSWHGWQQLQTDPQCLLQMLSDHSVKLPSPEVLCRDRVKWTNRLSRGRVR